MRTKFLSVVLFLLVISSAAFSQRSRAIVKAGVNLAIVSVSDNGNIDDANMLTSFQVGALGDIHVTSLLYFQPGLIFTGKGSKITIGRPEENLYVKQTSSPFYICLLYTSDAADERSSVDLGGRRIIKKK